MLIDSRMSSRMELNGFIIKSRLFKKIIFPESLHEASSDLSKHDVDICIFGPSVRVESIKTIMSDVLKNLTQIKSAFLWICGEDCREEISQIHDRVTFPCVPKIFNLGMVKALIRSNGGTFPIKRTNPLTGEAIDVSEILKKLGLDQNTLENYNESVDTNLHTPPPAIDIFAQHVFKKYQQLRIILREIEPCYLKFKDDGSPTHTTKKKVTSIVDELFIRSEGYDKIRSIKISFEMLIYEWIEIAAEDGKNAAEKRLNLAISELLKCLS
jgi:hypothetical protein